MRHQSLFIVTLAASLEAFSLSACTPTPALPMTTVAKSIASNPNTARAGAADPRDFLNEVDGEKAMAWVNTHNQSTVDRFAKDPRFAQNQADMVKILQATDRIPAPSFEHHDMIDNFWQDAEHIQGVWRRTTWTSYRSDSPVWDVILDIDALSKKEGKNWVYHGASCLQPDNARCLVLLSDGGLDAESIREFDVPSKSFVKGGFDLPSGKQQAFWVDKDTIYVAREWMPGEVTTSGYAFVTKRLKRGQSLSQAVEVFRGDRNDVSANRYPLRDVDGTYIMDMAERSLDFFRTRYVFYPGQTEVSLPLPATSTLSGYLHGQVIFRLKEDWTTPSGAKFSNGAIITCDLKASLADPAKIAPVVLFAPSDHQSVESISPTKNTVVLSILSDVTGDIRAFTFANNAWTMKKMDLPANSTLSIQAADDETDHVFVTASNFLMPSTLYRVDVSTSTIEKVKSSPDRFDAKGLRVQQRWATSKDGTRVPYFLVSKQDLPLDGSTPTVLNAYGGFEVSMLPEYTSSVGKLWLEKGGAFVVANIRGGGEFGPKWHEAGLKVKRQNIYDDFQAVAQDLIAQKITSPRRLGIIGGSNGGLLMGVQLTQRPDLWNAVVLQVPLLDMVNYTKMAAGASWIGEFGDPADPTEGAFLRGISPYHQVKAGTAYPEPLFETSTKDDRVGPVHARKMAALFEDMGLPFFYYENTEGGHAAAANPVEVARRYAMEYTYLAQKLMGK